MLPLVRQGRRFWIVVAALGAVVAWGTFAWTVQLREGLAVTGMSDRVSWGLYISMFVFFIGVSYGGTFVTARPSTIAVLPIGYADGYHRLASNRACVLVRGRRVPVAGRVCMDHTMIDVTDVPDVAVGDPVVLIGRQGAETVSAEELAGWCDTIPYEILCSLSERVPRMYV